MSNTDIFFTFFGVRGSYPVAGESVKKYGGNTTSLLIEQGQNIVIFDAGTGIIRLGEYLRDERPEAREIHLFLTHFHLDHLMGMSFFHPFSDKSYHIHIYYPDVTGIDINKTLFSMFEPPFSPIGRDGILANISLTPLDTRKEQAVALNGDLEVHSHYDRNHPVHGVMVFKAINQGKQLVFATDIEPNGSYEKDLKAFIHGADVLIHDAQYLDSDYYNPDSPTKGYGHSTFTMAVNNAIEEKAKKLYLFHHNPLYSDEKLEQILKDVRKQFKHTYLSKEYEKNSV